MSTPPTVTVDASNAPIAEKIVNEALKLAQQACANFVLDHLLEHANDPGATMPSLDAEAILKGADISEYRDAPITNNPSKHLATVKYFDGKGTKRSKAKTLTLQCRQISRRRKRNATKH